MKEIIIKKASNGYVIEYPPHSSSTYTDVYRSLEEAFGAIAGEFIYLKEGRGFEVKIEEVDSPKDNGGWVSRPRFIR